MILTKDEEGKIQDFKEEEELPSAPPVIEAENTLDMIQKQLGATKPWKKPVKKGVKKKTVAKVEKVDTETRMFNNYGDNPHLQNIENGYLKYLEAQHAKDSHLKAIKKFQIVYALKVIQRYWKKKY